MYASLMGATYKKQELIAAWQRLAALLSEWSQAVGNIDQNVNTPYGRSRKTSLAHSTKKQERAKASVLDKVEHYSMSPMQCLTS